MMHVFVNIWDEGNRNDIEVIDSISNHWGGFERLIGYCSKYFHFVLMLGLTIRPRPVPPQTRSAPDLFRPRVEFRPTGRAHSTSASLGIIIFRIQKNRISICFLYSFKWILILLTLNSFKPILIYTSTFIQILKLIILWIFQVWAELYIIVNWIKAQLYFVPLDGSLKITNNQNKRFINLQTLSHNIFAHRSEPILFDTFII